MTVSSWFLRQLVVAWSKTAVGALRLNTLLVSLSFLALSACNDGSSDRLGPGGLPQPGAATASACSTPQTGCACAKPGEVVDCGAVNQRLGDYVTCALGKRECVGNQWGECKTERISGRININDARYLALGQAARCQQSNSCDPNCWNYIDDTNDINTQDGGLGLWGSSGSGVGVGPGGGGGGVSLVPGSGPGGGGGMGCTGVAITPATANLVVTSYPFAGAPPSQQFTASMTPAGCVVGTVAAAWKNSDEDTAVITDQGVFTVYSPVAGQQTVTAYVGDKKATAVVNVIVDVQDNSQAPAGSVAQFAGAAVGNDTALVIYPYANTVFPRGVIPPVLQWEAGAAASAIKVSLRYPVAGPAEFTWSKIIPESNPPRAQIPQEVWAGFDQTAAGQQVQLSIQRVVGGTLRPAVTRNIVFSSAPLRGFIYHTEYGRDPDSDPDPISCEFGKLEEPRIRRIDPGTTQPGADPFETLGQGGNCGPVCHSVSADGRTFVTTMREYKHKDWPSGSDCGPGSGISRIDPGGVFKVIADAPKHPESTVAAHEDNGFAFAAITPDGKYVLQAANWWGNTMGDSYNLGGNRISAGNGNGLFADYFPNTSLTDPPAVSRIDPEIDFRWVDGAPDPAVPTDGFSVRWTGQIQALDTELYTFETTTNDGVRLWVDNILIIDHWVDGEQTWSGTISLVRGQKYDIKMEFYENSGDAQASLYWESDSTGYSVVPLNQLYAR